MHKGFQNLDWVRYHSVDSDNWTVHILYIREPLEY